MTHVEQRFEQYHTPEFAHCTKALQMLLDVVQRDGYLQISTDLNTFGAITQELFNVAQGYAQDTPEEFPYPQEKSLLSLFDQGVVSQFVTALTQWEKVLLDPRQSTRNTNTPEDASVRIVTEQDIDVFATHINVTSQSLTKVKEKFAAYGDIEKMAISVSFWVLQEATDALVQRISLLAAFVKITSQNIYTIADVQHILAGDIATYSDAQLSATVRYLMDNGEGFALANTVYEHLRIEALYKKVQYTWTEAFFLTAFLHVPFTYFDQLDWMYQEFWIKFYALRAQTAGIPITYVFQKHLYYETNNLADFALQNIFLFYALDENEEVMLLHPESGPTILKDLLHDYMRRLGDKFSDGYLREAYIDEHIAQSPSKGIMKHVLRKMLYLYSHLKTADLIEKNRGSEVTEKDVYENQLVHLLTWWMNEDFWPLIAEYFTTSHTPPAVVPLKIFLSQIQAHESLEQADRQDKIIRFSEFLRSAHILQEVEDLLVYNEQTGAFEWNDEVLVSSR
ncbi:MAG: hypothetical protein UV82_C0002G0088 [Candidatus Magasanikbacteria bacterium GW2011_GWD2_43_18]|uniref:Uncharacterized protein n=1 Tax=Candidatus Magasanikbacteria bacterium GW2011_GWE2_42_7 TaxID=1619052 RepID=A0A0G1BHF2_9BACT|nr:MAG: hypothetical protein UV18_C0003G0088 [Candidatus Magasanikbacteria bacterium GW2011_GWC2_42_27]KKS72609.1 MAG: hypothetical protein UV42_C0006G0009 [Candidatus Magasanikbacteria bacterium GW2011_GWE2_42_7]KKT05118.1 MAG: hypothetical protein UV82_C0002G0088 [Candidatus Magasanikbacteria bacterium GW2011_GWD2_43_18]KKT25791.1 MAG: hypothetical protein UW10_C0004G0066 [Candidatus Magasanikbacteria bacterium GW2011_GWA2_43_9]HBB38076.1 hypothetical protein [Candidatus Magasanikbacteria bac